MKPILIIQNVALESPGRVLDYLHDKHLSYTIVNTFNGQELPSVDSIEALITLGTPVSVNQYREHDYLKRLYEFITSVARRNMPYLGLCFGAQIMAHVLGAKVEAMKNGKEIGCHEVSLTDAGKADPLFEGCPDVFPAVHWHGDAFRIPFGCKALATTPHCPTQAFRRQRQAGLQFHLEVRAEDLPTWISGYPDEVAEVSLDAEKMVTDAQAASETMRTVSYRVLDNFLAL